MRVAAGIVFVFLWSALDVCAQTNKDGKYTAGIVYGPKGAYSIDAPHNWVLDNKAGASMGLPCVLYLDGYTWQNSPVVMYAKIASVNHEQLDKFIEFAIKESLKIDSTFQHNEVKTGKIAGSDYVIMDYQGGEKIGLERVLYIQMEKAVGYVVFSAFDEDDFSKYADAIFEVAVTYKYKPEFINYKEEQ